MRVSLSYYCSETKIGCGKSCLLKRLVKNQFIEDQVTVGVEFQQYMMCVEDKILKLQIWDTAGQENFKSVTKVFYRKTHAVLLCFPINSKQSFQTLNHWITEIQEKCEEDVLVFLVGNKGDLQDARQVKIE